MHWSALRTFLPSRAERLFIIAANLGLLFYSLYGLASVSLWHDEAWVAMSVFSPSIGEMLNWKEAPQVTPPLFLLAVRAITGLFGTGEAALRIFSVLCGVGVLNLTWLAARRVHGRGLAPVLAVLLYLGCLFAVRYNKEVKPYAAEMLVTLALLVYFGDSASGKDRPSASSGIWKDLVLVAGAQLLSNSAFLVLYPLVSLRAINAYRAGNRNLAARLAAVLLFSGLLLTAYYFAFLAGKAAHKPLLDFWKHGWPPRDPRGWPGFLHGHWKLFLRYVFLFADRAGAWALLGAFLALLAARRWQLLLLILAVPVEVFVLSLLRAFPFDPGSRLMLFYFPLLFIGMAAPVSQSVLERARGLGRHGPLLIIGLCAMFLILNARGQKKGIGYVYDYEPMKEYYAIISKSYQPQTDIIAVYRNSVFPFRYYNRERPLPFVPLDGPVDDLVQRSHGKRIWVVVTRPFWLADLGKRADLVFESDFARSCKMLQRHELQRGKLKNGILFLFHCP